MFPELIITVSLNFIVLLAKVEGYTQVETTGSLTGQSDGPKLFKALNMDLIFPRIFNSSENVVSTTQTSAYQSLAQTVATLPTDTIKSEPFISGHTSSETSTPILQVDEETTSGNHYHRPTFVTHDNHDIKESLENEGTLSSAATGRAVDYRPAYPFSQLLTPNSKGYRPSLTSGPYPLRPRPVYKPDAGQHQRVVYPSYQAPRTPSRAEIDKLSGKGSISDRFTPSEAVVSNAFKQKDQNSKRLVGQSTNKVSSFTSVQDLYAFPPNLNSRYPAPSEVRKGLPSETITSYLPPAAGTVETSKFIGPVNPDLLPDSLRNPPPEEVAPGKGYQYNPPPPKDMPPGKGYQYNPPPPKDTPSGKGYQYSAPPQPFPDTIVHNSPPIADGNEDEGSKNMGPSSQMDDSDVDSPETPPTPPVHDGDGHDYSHDIGDYVDGKEYPTPPPGYMEEHDHYPDDHHPRHPDIEFAQGPFFPSHYHHHHYPPHDIIYDDHFDHHVHHDHTEMPMTTEPPPPPPDQPRVKKYSYFYIGRKLWYIPLYFTVWFTFYILWLILKSIARHKVNLPNHYVNRRSIEELNHREARETIDKLTVKVMSGIEQFSLKFLSH